MPAFSAISSIEVEVTPRAANSSAAASMIASRVPIRRATRPSVLIIDSP